MLASKGFFRLLLMTGTAILAALLIMIRVAKAPVDPEGAVPSETQAPAASAAENRALVSPGCQVIQTMAFTRCGHSVTRRVNAPEALRGADFAAVQQYYDLWRVESYAGEQIAMSREIALFCPMHTVVGVNEAGNVVLSRNVYGDGMAVVKTCPLTLDDLPESERDALLSGMGFETDAEAEAWLNSHKKARGPA